MPLRKVDRWQLRPLALSLHVEHLSGKLWATLSTGLPLCSSASVGAEMGPLGTNGLMRLEPGNGVPENPSSLLCLPPEI